jgi:hypothetical protein
MWNWKFTAQRTTNTILKTSLETVILFIFHALSVLFPNCNLIHLQLTNVYYIHYPTAYTLPRVFVYICHSQEESNTSDFSIKPKG